MAALFAPAEPTVWRRLTLMLVLVGSASLVCADTVVPGLFGVTGSVTPTKASEVPLDLTTYYSGSPSAVRIWLESVTTAPNLASSGGIPVNLLTADPQFVVGTHYGPKSPNTPFAAVEGVILTGTELRSYMVHWAQPTGAGNNVISGTLTFDFPIIGVVAMNTIRPPSSSYRWLDGTDSLGLPGRTYPQTGDVRRAIDSTQDEDYITISDDRKTLFWQLRLVGNSYDEFRIITATPEPAAVVLFGTVAVALLGAVIASRRRQARRRGAADSRCQRASDD